MYDLSDYGRMLADRRRLGAYETAVRQLVSPGATVVEIGTGPGILAVLACRLGARKVYAIEPNDIIQVARDVATANGCADRVVCIQDLSTRVTLPERADLIVSDLRDVLPLFGHHVPSIVDARTRLLAPGGSLIPQRDVLWASIADAPEAYARHVGPWDGGNTGVDMDAGRRLAANTWCKARIDPDQLLVDPKEWAAIDYTTVASPNVAGDVGWIVSRGGTGHGLCLWFETWLTPDVHMSNAPGQPELLYGTAFFPWPEPVTLTAGDHVDVRLRANLVGDDYVWRWETEIRPGDAPGSTHRFTQSTFFAELLSPVREPPASAVIPPSSQVSGDEGLRLEQAMSAAYWTGVNPQLSVCSPSRVDAMSIDATAVAALADRFRTEGYFELPGALEPGLVTRMRKAVEALRRDGWPLVFAFVYDEFWLAARSSPIAAFLTAALGDEYRQIPHVWTHYVQPSPGASGWPPHYDDPKRSERVTVWIALTDATLDNGCMYVVPRNRVPASIADTLPDLDMISMAHADALMQGIRALPAAAGTALGWAFDVMHWGSVCSREGEPRIAISQEFIAAGAAPADDERPLFDAQGDLPPLSWRLHAIGKAILDYQRFDPQPGYAAIAASLVHDG